MTPGIEASAMIRFRGTAHLIVPIDPFQLAVRLDGTEQTREFFWGRVAFDLVRDDSFPRELIKLIKVGSRLSLQLSYDSDTAPVVILPVEVLDEVQDRLGMSLKFKFLAKASELDEIFEQLSGTYSQSVSSSPGTH